jgi:hypothetical protein
MAAVDSCTSIVEFVRSASVACGWMNPSGRTRLRGVWTIVLWVIASSAVAGDWPGFRGPAGNGVAQEAKAPLRWGPGKNVCWKTPLPGPGNSSPIVTTASRRNGRFEEDMTLHINIDVASAWNSPWCDGQKRHTT